jgi:CRP/FNR family transcriptional regulator/voltage-gated potassium channel
MAYEVELSAVSIFAGLKKADLTRLGRSITEREFKKGRAIVTQGATATAFYIITKGRTEVLIASGKKRPTKVKEMGRGAFFGEMALIDGARRRATVRALTDTECLVLPRKAFLAELRANPKVAVAMLPALAAQAREDANDQRPVAELMRYL